MTSWTVDNPATRLGAVDAAAPDLASGTAVKVNLTSRGSLDATNVSVRVMLRPSARTQVRISLRSLSGRVRSGFAGARYGNVGGMSGNVSVTSASGAITLLGREPVGSETR